MRTLGLNERSVYIYNVAKSYGFSFGQEKIKQNPPVPKRHVRAGKKIWLRAKRRVKRLTSPLLLIAKPLGAIIKTIYVSR